MGSFHALVGEMHASFSVGWILKTRTEILRSHLCLSDGLVGLLGLSN